MNDLTVTFNEIIDEYTGELGGIVDLESWHKSDIELLRDLLEKVLEQMIDDERY